MAKFKLTTDEIKHLALLSVLVLSSEEIEKYTKQISETITFVENLDELNTENVVPTNNGIHLENVYFEDGTVNTRKLSQEESLQNASKKKPENNPKYFIVDRIMQE